MKKLKRSLFFGLMFLLNHQFLHSQDKNDNQEIYQLYDITLEDILNIDIVSATLQKQSVQDAPANAIINPNAQYQSAVLLSLILGAMRP